MTSLMFRKLRTASKIDKILPKHPTPPETTNFFSLPPELRDVIYDLASEDITLTLVPRKWRRPPPPSMLLVSRQTKAEYEPYLLTKARIVANVYNYDFRNITRMASSLYSTQLKLLRQSNNLIIRLHCLRCRPQDLDLLRRWLVQRSDSLDRLLWTYEIGWSGNDVPLSAKPDMLVNHLEMLMEMKTRMKLDERFGWELLPICAGIQTELGEVQQQLAEEKAQRQS